MNKKLDILRGYFGHTNFRPGQEEIIDSILSGRDVLGIMPTGSGKSVCYQIPALLLPGVTLVISPLISLMEDQTASLLSHNISAVCINSSMNRNKLNNVYKNMTRGAYKLIYVSPERLLTPYFRNVCADLRISLICVDEAHCISSWGKAFRPAYRNIAGFTDTLSAGSANARRPVIAAFTATATVDIKNTIIRSLGLSSPVCVNTGYERKDLSFSVVKCATPGQKFRILTGIIRKHAGQCGIIYCSTRASVEYLRAKLQGYAPVFKYHGGMTSALREHYQNEFIRAKNGIMCATCAFGMGIDKSDIRYVIHYEIPGSIEDYYQEAGRASRDGKGAECVLLYSLDDMITRLSLIDETLPLTHMSYTALRAMINYAMHDGDYMEYMVRYFNGSLFKRRQRIKRASAEFIRKDHPGLTRLMRIVRSRIASSFRKPVSKIASDTVTDNICAALPASLPDLILICGMNPLSAFRYGKYFLFAVSVYVHFYES